MLHGVGNGRNRGELAWIWGVVSLVVLLAMLCEEALHLLHHRIFNLPNANFRVDQVPTLTSANFMQSLSTAIAHRQHGAFFWVSPAISGTVALVTTFITVSKEPVFKFLGHLVAGLVEVWLPFGPWLDKTPFVFSATCTTTTTSATATSLICGLVCRVLCGIRGVALATTFASPSPSATTPGIS